MKTTLIQVRQQTIMRSLCGVSPYGLALVLVLKKRRGKRKENSKTAGLLRSRDKSCSFEKKTTYEEGNCGEGGPPKGIQKAVPNIHHGDVHTQGRSPPPENKRKADYGGKKGSHEGLENGLGESLQNIPGHPGGRVDKSTVG